jgi:DNA-binding PadR family transcriptional regulator
MEKRLKNLKKTMKNTTFSGLEFNDVHRQEIHQKLQKEESEEEILHAVFQLLVYEKTGFELAKQLRGRGIRKFEDHEGLLYTVLHRMEHKEYLETKWTEDNGKVYRLSRKGSRILKKQEKSCAEAKAVLGTLLEVRSYGG